MASMPDAPIKMQTIRAMGSERRDLIIVGPYGWASIEKDMSIGDADAKGRQYASMLDVPFEPFGEMPA